MTTTVWQPATLYQKGSIVVPSAVTLSANVRPANADFASGDSDWTKGTGWVINDDDAFVSTYSAVNTSTGDDLAIVNDTKAECSPGLAVTAKCVVLSDSSDPDSTGAVFLRWYDSLDAEIETDVGNYVGGSDSWKQSTVTATAPSGAASVSVGAIVQKETSAAIRVDAFTWNYVPPSADQELAYKATQDDAGLSGDTEPVWPTTVGNTVVDNEVTWEAFEANRVVWEASPILVSGATEPDWPVEGGGLVSDGTIAWKAVPFHIEDENCPNTKEVAIAASKIFAGDDDITRFCATLNPRDWSTAQDAGFIPSGLQQRGQVGVTVLNNYRGNLCIWSPSTFQMWQVDPDPAAMALLDTIEGIGSSHYRAAQPVSNDLFFLSALGVRTVGLSAGSGNLQAGDVGMPIDVLVQAAVEGKAPLATYYPSAGQYWLTTAKTPPVPADEALSMACPIFDTYTVGSAFTHTPTVIGGDTLSFAISAGTLPPGLSLDPVTGEITGTLTTQGEYDFTYTVSSTGWQSASCQFTVFVLVPVYAAVRSEGRLAITDAVDGRWMNPIRKSTTNAWPAGSGEINGIAYGNGLFVANVDGASTDDCIFTSTDLVTWTAQDTPVSGPFREAIAYGNGVFVVYGQDASNVMRALYSYDGELWESGTVAGSVSFGIESVIYGASKFYGCNLDGSIVSSDDGITWSLEQDFDATFDWYGIAYNGSMYVVCGQGKLATSADGSTWTERTSPATQARSVAALGSTFIMGDAASSNVYTSTDGITWSTVASGISDTRKVAVFNSIAWVTNDNGALATSTDGATWTARTVDGISGQIEAFTLGYRADHPDENWTKLVSLNRFAGSDASTTFVDEMDVPLTASGGAMIDEGAGIFGTNAVFFDGVDDVLRVSTDVNPLTLSTNDYSVEFWVEPDEVTGDRCVLDYAVNTGNDGLRIYTSTTANPGKLTIITGTGTTAGVSTTSIPAGQATHIRVTRSGTSLKATLGGVVEVSATDSGTHGQVRYTLGAKNDNTHFYAGRVSMLRMYNEAAISTGAFTVPTAAFPEAGIP